MANVFVTNTARFNPFSYQELAAPLMQASEMQYALEDTLSNMDDGTIESYLAGEKSDSPYVTRYNALIDRLKSASTELASKGISPGLIRDIKALSGDYKKFSAPVEAAGKRKAADVATYNKLYASDPTLIGDNPNEISLQQYIDNPSYSAKYTSGKTFQSYGATLGAQMATQFNPIYRTVQGGKFYEVQTKKVASMDEIKNNPEYKSAIDNLMISQGYDPASTDPLTQRVRSEIENGMFMGMQDAGITRISNPGWGRSPSSTTKKEPEYAYSEDGNTRYHKVNDKWVKQLKKDDGSWSDNRLISNKEQEELGLVKPASGSSRTKGQQIVHTFSTKPSLDGRVVKDRPSLDVNKDYQELSQINFDLGIEDSDAAIDEYFNSGQAPELTDESYKTLSGILHRKAPSTNREKYELLRDATESGLYIEVTPISRGKQHIYIESLKEKAIHTQDEDIYEDDGEKKETSPFDLKAFAEAVKNEGTE